jgi:hypothetical protein
MHNEANAGKHSLDNDLQLPSDGTTHKSRIPDSYLEAG